MEADDLGLTAPSDIGREELRETPARMARACAGLFDARPVRLTMFANDEGQVRELVAAPRRAAGHTLRADHKSAITQASQHGTSRSGNHGS